MQQNITPNAVTWCDELKFNRLHGFVVFIVGMIILSEGYGVLLMSVLIPGAMKEWSLTPVAAGALASYTFIGLLIGALGFGMLGDIIGRKNAMVLTVLTFPLFTGFSYWAPNFSSFVILRFLAGLGMGGTMPLAIALVSEYVPSKARARSVTTVFLGLPAGTIVAIICAMTILPRYGWRSLLLIGFLVLILIPIIMVYLPEPIRYLSQKQRYKQATRELRRLERAAGVAPLNWTTDSFALHVEAKASIKHLFTSNLARMTILIWCVYIFDMLFLFGTQTWLPALFIKRGFGVVKSFSYALVLQVALALGTLLLGWVMDRFGRKQGLILCFILGGLATCSFSVVHSNMGFYIVGAIWGLTGGACVTGIQVLPGETYPTQLRSTGAGWAVAAGRAGAVAGPLLGGALLMAGFTFGQFFIMFALPAFICAALVFFFPVNIKNESVETATGRLVGTIPAGEGGHTE